jgi:hypothetical protein
MDCGGSDAAFSSVMETLRVREKGVRQDRAGALMAKVSPQTKAASLPPHSKHLHRPIGHT